MVWLTLLIATADASNCSERVPSSTFAASVHSAEASFAAMALEDFEDAFRRAERELPCLAEPLTRGQAAAWHRASALRWFILQNLENTVAAYGSSLAREPDHTLDPAIAPEGHPLADAYETARMRGELSTFALPPPADAYILIDGEQSLTRPLHRPIVLQFVSKRDGVLWSRHILPEDIVPGWTVAEDNAEEILEKKRKRRIALGLATGGLLVTSGALYAGALATKARFNDVETPYERLSGLRSSANAMTVTSLISGLGAAGLGITMAVDW